MKSRLMRTVVLVACLATPLAALATEPELDPLLELLVEQGVITLEQARGVQAEYDRRAASQADASSPVAVEPSPPPAAEPAAAAYQESVTNLVTLPAAGEELKGVKNLKVGALAYLSYQDGTKADGSDYNDFVVKRAYIDIRKQLTSYFGARITPDVVQQADGNLELRFKYLYGQFNWDGFGLLQSPYVEFGVAHMPWLDFEEHINRFRMQDTMFMERNALFNSADLGVLFGANLGPELDEEYRERVNDNYAGRWGSFGIGVYNGGGYHAVENNTNQVIEGRLSVRPIPGIVPGLQLSVFGVSGRGNDRDELDVPVPDWDVLAGMISYESPRFVATAQYERGSGNQKGSAVGPDGAALEHDGYSFFTEIRLDREQKFSVIGRYDRFDIDRNDPESDVKTRWIAGFAWRFYKGNYWLLDYDRLEHVIPGLDTEDRVQLTLQLKY
jgi:hypothetical protein